MTEPGTAECPPNLLFEAAETAKSDVREGVFQLDQLLNDYPRDPRLHFLRGSLLAGLQDYAGARAAVATAVGLEPGYALARFQLGFLELTSGLAAEAEATWRPLGDLPEKEPLRIFARGLVKLAHDELADAAQLLKEGMSLNSQNPIINKDMQLIIDQINEIGRSQTEDRSVSATQLLLRQYEAKRSRP